MAQEDSYQFDIVVIGGGPAGYAAAIRAGQLKRRVLCIEKESLGGTCLNWGCIPTKSLLEDGALVRTLREGAAEHGVSFQNLQVDFGRMVSRSRAIADKLSRGIAYLFGKYNVKHQIGTGRILASHRVEVSGKEGPQEVTARHIIIATGARATQLRGLEFDQRRIISSRQAMILPQAPKSMAIIGGGAIGCEFADFYNAVGTELTIVEMLDHLLPAEDREVSIALERSFAKRGIRVHTKTKVQSAEQTGEEIKLQLEGQSESLTVDVVLVAVGVSGNTENLFAPEAKTEMTGNRIKVDSEYRTSLEDVFAVGDVIAIAGSNGRAAHPDLAHVAHHEAVYVVEKLCGLDASPIDYRFIPGCTYTHPQVASMGMTEETARQQGRETKVGKFPFAASGRALAAGHAEGFVKLVFDSYTGELLGAHMIGQNVTELLAELVLAHNLEATEEEIIRALHPHPTMSEAVMEAAGVAEGRAIHL